jgi:hypothetical protein
MRVSDFNTFRELLLYCMQCRDSGKSQEALTLIEEYLCDPRAERVPDSLWAEYNIQQALGFRVAFLENVDSSAALAAEERHLAFCKHQLQYWVSSAADSAARLSLSRFQTGDASGGREAAREAAQLAGTAGHISVTVAQAAQEARKDRS